MLNSSLRPAPPPSLAPLRRTDEPQIMFGEALEAARAGHKLALVTLVEATKGSARAVGAQMIVLDDGRHCGMISGGCTEAAVAAEAAASIAADTDRKLLLGEGSPFFDIVIPCGGTITLLIQIVRDISILEIIATALQDRTRFTITCDIGRSSLTVQTGAGTETGWHDDVFVRAYRPQTRLVIAGRGLELESLAALATAGGLNIKVLSPDTTAIEALRAKDIACKPLRSGPIDDIAIDQDTAVAILFHDLDWELPVLEAALASPAFYIGALGSARTHEKRCDALARRGQSEAAIARIKGPIGLFGPARDAATLATSILADVQATRSSAS